MYSKAYTLGEFRGRILKLLQRYSSNGTIVQSGEKADIENRLVTSLNIHLTRLMYEFSDNIKRRAVSFFMPGCAADFGSMSLCAGENVEKNVKGQGLAFYMEARGEGTVEISLDGRTLTRRIYTDNGAYTVVRGILGNDMECECTFRISCDTYLDIKNFTVYEGTLDARGDGELICAKSRSSAYIPDDCAEILAVYERNGAKDINTNFSVLEEERIVFVPRCANDEYIIEYVPYAPQFSESEGDSSQVCISPLTADALCYMCAADLCPVNQPELYSKLTYKYREILENTYTRHRKNGMINRFYGFVRKRGIGSVKSSRREVYNVT